MRIIVAGTGRLGSCVMEPLIHSHHDVVGLLQNGRKIKGLMRNVAQWESYFYAKIDQPIRFAL